MIQKGKGERHFYIKNGKPVQWIGETHKHPDGTLMSGKEHKEGVSKKLLHFYELDEKHLKHLSKETTVIKEWKEILKKDKKDMRVGRVYSSDREGKKIMMLTHEGKKIHAGAKGYGNYKGKGKNRGGGTHTNKKRRANFKSRHNCDQCKGRITTPKCLACKKLW